MDLLLTDDEIVALTIEDSKFWPTGLPTVDVEREEQLITAALRGRRSLGIRGLIDPDSPHNELLILVRRHAVGAPSFACLHLADPDGTRSVDSVNLNAYPGPESWIVESVSDAGVHQFSKLSNEQLLDLYDGLASAVFERGLSDARTANALAISSIGPTHHESISVSHSAIQSATPTTSSRGETHTGSSTIRSEIERLLSMTNKQPSGPIAASV